MIAGLLGWFSAAVAAPGTEFVLVIDNSCSMVETHREGGEQRPPADPDRRAVVGAQIVEGLTRGTEDALTVLAFPLRAGQPVPEVRGAQQIRELQPAAGTFFAGPLDRAQQILSGSARDRRMLLFLSDGQPGDLDRPADGRARLGLPPAGHSVAQVPFDTLILGLLPEADPAAEGYLRPLARAPEDYVRVQDGSTLVTHFTRGYARALGSKALTGTLAPGARHTIEVGRYVEEVLAVTTSVERTGPYTATLTGPQGALRPKASGDNGCARPPPKNRTYCSGPRIHHTVWRAPHDPRTPSRYTLAIEQGGGEVAWGLILRYDLDADLTLPAEGKVGAPARVQARLLHDGAPLDDPSFFDQDGFQALARVDGRDIPLTHAGEGVFEGRFTPLAAGAVDVEVRFHNAWMEERATGQVQVAQPPPLQLRAPPVLDFGSWRGERAATTRCLPLQISSNHAYDPERLGFRFQVPDDVRVSIVPTGPVLTACVSARGCCGDLLAPDTAALVVEAVDLDGSASAATIQLRYQVDRTGFLRCWWPWLAGLLALLVVLWFLYGWIRPHDFDEELTVKVAGSERQLARAASLVLREQPKGRRGFYRNARIALSGTGDFVAHPRNAAVWIEATGPGATRIHPRGPVEIRDRRTKKWERLTEEQAADGVRTHEIYRVGDIFLRFQ